MFTERKKRFPIQNILAALSLIGAGIAIKWAHDNPKTLSDFLNSHGLPVSGSAVHTTDIEHLTGSDGTEAYFDPNSKPLPPAPKE